MISALQTLRRDFGGDIIEPGGRGVRIGQPLGIGFRQSGLCASAQERRGRAGRGQIRRRARGSVLSVRGGGHGFPGFGTNDGGVVIDLSKLAEVEVIDDEQHLVRIGGGATWGQVAAALAPHGLAISSGDTKSVGVGGLTLAGGIGWKVRKYGLALDNVVAAEMVMANGSRSCPRARQENPELFWAIRGGGGNFGIVTAFEFAAHPTTDVFYGKIAFPASEAATVLQGWADYIRAAPDELTSVADLANPFAGGPEAPIEIYVAFDGDDPELAAEAHRPDPPARHGDRRRCRADALCGHARGRRDPAAWHPARNAEAHSSTRNRCPRSCRSLPRSGRRAVAVHRGSQRQRCRLPSPDDATAYAHRRAELMFVTTAAGPEPVVEAAGARSGGDLGETGTARHRRVRELPRFCDRGGCRRDLPSGDLSAARGGQASVRPRQPVRPQPQRPASVSLGGQARRRPWGMWRGRSRPGACAREKTSLGRPPGLSQSPGRLAHSC